LSAEAASVVGKAMRGRQIKKTYHALVRGYTDTYGSIEKPLTEQPAVTLYETLGRCQVPLKVGKWPSARYSLVRVEPLTGRTHQIRRHLNHLSHPIIGDSDHGDRSHNRAYIHDLGIPGMFLRASTLELTHPITGHPLCISIKDWEPRWHAAFQAMGLCPVLSPSTAPPSDEEGMADEEDEAADPPISLLQHALRLSQQPLHTVLDQLQQASTGPMANKIAADSLVTWGQLGNVLRLSEQVPVKPAAAPSLTTLDQL